MEDCNMPHRRSSMVELVTEDDGVPVEVMAEADDQVVVVTVRARGHEAERMSVPLNVALTLAGAVVHVVSGATVKC